MTDGRVADRRGVDKTTPPVCCCCSLEQQDALRIRTGAHITVHWKQHHLHAPTDVQVHFVGTSLFFAPSRPRNSLSSREFVSP